MKHVGILMGVVGMMPLQEAPDIGLFGAIVTAAASEAGFEDKWTEGRPVIVDLASFRAADRSLAQLPEAAVEAAFERPVRHAAFSEVEDCTKPGRWRCGIDDDGLHLEVLSIHRRNGEVDARVRSRKYVPDGVAGLCPREVLFTFRPSARGGWSLRRTVVDVTC